MRIAGWVFGGNGNPSRVLLAHRVYPFASSMTNDPKWDMSKMDLIIERGRSA